MDVYTKMGHLYFQIVSLHVSKPTLTVEKDVLLHDLNNLGADVGGYVGIMLGVSCLNLFDMLAVMALKLRKLMQ